MYVNNFGGKNMHLKNNGKTKKDSKKAFTLAETLLTLTIVGVIAALTIPAMKEHSDMSSIIAQTQKAYLTAQSATSAVESAQGDLELWPWSQTATINNYYKNVMNVVPDNAWTGYQTYEMDGDIWANIQPPSYFKTTDGMSWYIYNWSNGTDMGNSRIYGVIHVDVNGASGPNRVGVDVHAFTVSSDGVNPMGDGIHDTNSTWACTNYIIKHGKMPWYNDASYTTCADQRIYKK